MEEEILWIEAIQRGETQYFQKLYQKHHQKLFSLCYRFTHNIHDAEEQLQEIFMRLLNKLDRFQGRSSFSTWVYRLAVNHMINFGRRRQETETPAHMEPAIHSDPDLGLVLEQALATLPEGFRKVLILHDREGFRHDEIAAILECSPATSRSQLCRARLALREKLKPVLSKEAT